MVKIFRTVASCIAVLLALTAAELTGTAATQEQHQHSKTHVSRRNRAPKQKAHRKSVRRRQKVSYVCPMHPDIRSKSRGTCPKCLMDLVAERRDAMKR